MKLAKAFLIVSSISANEVGVKEVYIATEKKNQIYKLVLKCFDVLYILQNVVQKCRKI